MRRTILITLNSLFLTCAGLWVGAIIGIGAMAAPAAFRDLEGLSKDGIPIAGVVIGHALQRLNTVSVILVALMLAIALFEMFYRKRIYTKKTLFARWMVVMAAMLISVYLSAVMMPQMQRELASHSMDVFRAFHRQYRMWSWAQVILGIVAIVQTNAVNIGPRRDGGHPRNVK